MKFTVSSSKLFAELQVVSRALPNKHTVRILETIMFDLQGSVLNLIASNGDLLIRTNIEVDSSDSDNGRVCISPNLLLDSLKELSNQPVTFEIDKTNFKVVISSQTGFYNCVGFDGEQYPELEVGLSSTENGDGSEEHTLMIPTIDFSKAVAFVFPCTRNDEYVEVINSIYFDCSPDGMNVVGTDTQRLAKYTCNSVKSDIATHFLLNRKVAKVIQGLITDEMGDMKIHYTAQRAEFDFANRHVSAGLAEASYPDYRSVIAEGGQEMIIDRQSLLNACKRVWVFSDQSTGMLRFALNGANELHLSSQDINYATSAEETLTCSYTDQPIELGLKSSSMVEMLDLFQSSDIVFKIFDETKAVQLLPSEKEDGCEYIALIMPMLKGE